MPKPVPGNETPDSDRIAHIESLIEGHSAALAECGYDGVVILADQAPRQFLDDQHYRYQPNPHFVHWTSLLRHPGSAVILWPGHKPRLVIHQTDDFWEKPPELPDGDWIECFELDTSPDALTPDQFARSDKKLAVISGQPAGGVDLNPQELLDRLHLNRTRKTAWEVACLRQATWLAVAGHLSAERAFRAGSSELEIYRAWLSGCGQLEGELPYPAIIGQNENASVLHYQFREASAPESPGTLLIDAGCQFRGYASDITRTWAASGNPLTDIIADLDERQQTLAASAVAGTDFTELHATAHEHIGAILATHGIVGCRAESAVEQGLTRAFLPHGLGHFLGIQVHDVAGHLLAPGETREPPPRDGWLRITRTLEAGNVLTIEPGIYFIPVLLKVLRDENRGRDVNWERVEELLPFGGVRIEDNVVVGDEGNENLTREAFGQAG